MISLKPFLERIAELEKRVRELEAGQAREPKGHQKESGSKNLDVYEQRALEAEQRIAALTQQFSRLEQLASAGHSGQRTQTHPQHSGTSEKDKKEKHDVKEDKDKGKEKSKGGKGKDQKKEVTKFVGSQRDLHKKAGSLSIPIVHKNETKEQYLCTFCQTSQKVFFNCSNKDCLHRCCRSCIQACKTCENVICRWCGDCWKCDIPSQNRLSHHVKTVQDFVHANSDHLAHSEDWPGVAWIDYVLGRLLKEDPSDLFEGDSVSSFFGVLLSLNWTSKAEVRALQYIVPILRALLTHQPFIKAAQH